MSRLARGFVAGAWATLAMAGIGLTLRRMMSESEALSKTDPEHTIDWLFAKTGRPEPGTRLRRRLADPLHLMVGGTGGAVYAVLSRDRDVSPWLGGAFVGGVMWILGFCGYLPLLGVLPRPWRWPPEKLVITSIAHLVYGWTMALLLRQIAPPSRVPSR